MYGHPPQSWDNYKLPYFKEVSIGVNIILFVGCLFQPKSKEIFAFCRFFCTGELLVANFTKMQGE